MKHVTLQKVAVVILWPLSPYWIVEALILFSYFAANGQIPISTRAKWNVLDSI
jgi:hypothetical protein